MKRDGTEMGRIVKAIKTNTDFNEVRGQSKENITNV